MAPLARPNFVLFNPDEWRADCAGCYAASRPEGRDPIVETPNLDRLAAGPVHGAGADREPQWAPGRPADD
jgi:arylsulfatase A-like enzyme